MTTGKPKHVENQHQAQPTSTWAIPCHPLVRPHRGRGSFLKESTRANPYNGNPKKPIQPTHHPMTSNTHKSITYAFICLTPLASVRAAEPAAKSPATYEPTGRIAQAGRRFPNGSSTASWASSCIGGRRASPAWPPPGMPAGCMRKAARAISIIVPPMAIRPSSATRISASSSRRRNSTRPKPTAWSNSTSRAARATWCPSRRTMTTSTCGIRNSSRAGIRWPPPARTFAECGRRPRWPTDCISAWHRMSPEPSAGCRRHMGPTRPARWLACRMMARTRPIRTSTACRGTALIRAMRGRRM